MPRPRRSVASPAAFAGWRIGGLMVVSAFCSHSIIALAAYAQVESEAGGAFSVFEVPTQEGTLRGAVTADGDLLWTGREIALDEIPRELLRALLEGSVSGPSVESDRIALRLDLLAFELEMPAADGMEREVFLDSMGRELAVIEKRSADEGGEEQSVSLAEIEPEQARTIQQYVGGLPITRLQRERDWGCSVVAVRWQGVHGSQELKVLESGELLFVEVPPPARLPAAVAERSEGARIEALYLRAYALVDLEWPRPASVVLSAGARVDLGDRKEELGKRPASE